MLHLWDETIREVIFASREASFTKASLKLQQHHLHQYINLSRVNKESTRTQHTHAHIHARTRIREIRSLVFLLRRFLVVIRLVKHVTFINRLVINNISPSTNRNELIKVVNQVLVLKDLLGAVWGPKIIPKRDESHHT